MLDANKIRIAYDTLGYKYDVGTDVYNICYPEGLDPDGTPNGHVPNHFDDLRVVWQAYEDGTAKVLGAWEATTRAGKFFEVLHPMQPEGAFHIALGQQSCWRMGQYHDQEALIQTEPITGTRDVHRDYQRNGPILEGVFGVHHHWGYNYPHDDLGRSSAGCQVGRTKDGHRQFIALIKNDRRYKQDHQHLWTSTVLTAEQYVQAVRPVKPKFEQKPSISSYLLVKATGLTVGMLSAWGAITIHPLWLIAPVVFLMAVGGILIYVRHKKK